MRTGLWFHQTEIPSTTTATDKLSLSYARDFFFGAASDPRSHMTNIDGPVAARAREACEGEERREGERGRAEGREAWLAYV